MTHYRKGFRTAEAALNYQLETSFTPAFCCLHPALRGDVFVTCPVERASGKVYVTSYKAMSKGGDIKTYFASYIGA